MQPDFPREFLKTLVMFASLTAQQQVQRCQQILAHAWMVRTFIKHSEEVEDFPELMPAARAVFDTCRAVEHLIDNPPEYLRIVKKKLPKLRRAAEQFAADAPQASIHMNFQQAAISLLACCQQMDELTAEALPPRPAPSDNAQA